MNRRVVITGAGCVSALGHSTKEFWDNCLKGKSIVEPIPQSWNLYADYKSHIWSPLHAIDFDKWGLGRIERLQTDPVSLLAICAANEALDEANLVTEQRDKKRNSFFIKQINPSRVGVFMGTGIGGACSFLENHYNSIIGRHKETLQKILADGVPFNRLSRKLRSIVERMYCLKRVNPFIVSMLMPNAVSAGVGLKYSITGPNETTAGACAAGTIALGHAFRAVSDGVVDVALGGGAEFLYDHYGYIFRGFDASGTLVHIYDDPDKANCPFDRKRSGFLFSQGASGVLVLEDLEHAINRGAPLIAEVLGYGETFDAYSIMGLEPKGKQIERMIRMLLEQTGLNVGDLHYINAHGTGTKNNDYVEASVLKKIFNMSVLVNSTKSLLGHSIGASGALEAIVTAYSIRDQTTHVSKNLDDPEVGLNFVQRVEKQEIKAALSQSFAFGGANAGLIIAQLRL